MEFKSNLEDIESRFSMLLKSIPIPALLWKKKNNFLTLVNNNEQSSRISGGKVKEYIGKKASEIYKNNFQILKVMQECALDNHKFNLTENDGNPIVNNGISYNISFELLAPDTIVQYFTENSSVNKKILKYDTSKKNGKQEQLIQQATIDCLCKVAPIGIGMVVNRNIVQVNDRFCDLVGYDREELINKSVRIIYPSDEEYEYIEKEIFDQINKFGTGTVETQLRRKDGKIIQFLLSSALIDTKNPSLGTIFTALDITKTKTMENELITMEKRFTEFVNMLPLIVFEIDTVGNLSFVNEKGFELFGYSPEDIGKGFSALQLLIPPDRRRALVNMLKNAEGENLGGVEYVAQKKNGEKFPILVYSLPLISDEKHIGFRGTLIDITDRKNRETELKESEETYRILSENSDDLISLYDEKYRLIYINTESHSRVLGYPAKKFLKASFKNIIAHKDDVIPLIDIVKKGIQKGGYRGQIRFKHQEGYYMWFQITAKFFSLEPEKRKLLVVARNITDIKQAEENLKESEEKFRTIAELAYIGIMIIQEDEIKYVNGALLDIFGFSFKDTEGWTKEDITKLIHPEDLEPLRAHRRNLRKGVPGIKKYYSYRTYTKNGKLKWIDQFSKFIIFKGELAELITIIDITEKKEAEDALIKLNKLKSESFVRTSHELKTPLISIKGFSDLLLTAHRSKLDDYTVSKITEIKNGADRLQKLIGDILKAAELEAGFSKIKLKNNNLSNLIHICVREVQGFADLRSHELKINIQPKIITNFEEEQIHKVVSNLLSNAIKYTPPNGKIEIISEIRGNLIITSIKDNGIGFTSEEKQKIFKQYGKIERYGQNLEVIQDGNGLGLFISRKIVELHGGKIWVESDGRNRGSTFYFTLPLTKSQ
jgi:hypothetical protein